MIKALALSLVFSTLLAPAYAGDIGDIIMNSKADSMKNAGLGPVVYPHALHEELYKCEDCHPKIFIEKTGANDIDMEKNINEQQCGYAGCHNSAYAFPLYLCENCHLEKGAPIGK